MAQQRLHSLAGPEGTGPQTPPSQRPNPTRFLVRPFVWMMCPPDEPPGEAAVDASPLKKDIMP